MQAKPTAWLTMLPNEGRSVWTEASLLLSNPKVSQRINQIKEQRAKDSAVRREAVEKVLYDIVMADPKDLYILDSSTGKVKLKRTRPNAQTYPECNEEDNQQERRSFL